MDPFVKIYGNRLLRSSLWMEPVDVRLAFIGMLAIADESGFVDVPNTAVLAHALNMPEERVIAALRVLEAPDPGSRSPDHDGRRVIRQEGGWFCVNHQRYRDFRTRKQEATRKRVAKHRAQSRGNTPPVTSVTCNDVTAEAEAEAEAEPPKGPPGGPDARPFLAKPEEVAREYRRITGLTDLSLDPTVWTIRQRDAVSAMQRWSSGELGALGRELRALRGDAWLARQPVHIWAERLGTSKPPDPEDDTPEDLGDL